MQFIDRLVIALGTILLLNALYSWAVIIPLSFPGACKELGPGNATKEELACLETVRKEGLVEDLKNDSRFNRSCIPVAKALAENDTSGAARRLHERIVLPNVTMLHAAAMKGRIASLKCLIDVGLQVNATDGLLWTPLHFAVGFRQMDAAKVLVKAGTCLGCKDLLGYSALRFARGWAEDIADYLESIGAPV